jgi:HD-GYP domain-containing protein (c-di-GMP phosphodiesterase class II)
MDAAWREVLRGTVEPEEILNVPGPEVIPFSLSRSSLSEAAIAAEKSDVEDRESVANGSTDVDLGEPLPLTNPTGKLANDLYRDGHEVLRRVFALIRTGSTVDTAPLEALASEIVTAAKENVEIVQLSLTENSGNDLQVQQINVAILASRIGLGLQWSDAPPARLALASLVHGVGLLRVPAKILNKPGKLTKKEKKLVRSHPEWGEAMVRDSLPRLRWLPRVLRQVHERVSGSGYPDGLTGDEIDPMAKVIGLADALEALTHPRPWRPPLLAFDAIQLLMEEHARDFDPHVFRVMVRQISLFPVGSLVQLNNGSVAQVISINAENFYRPKVEMVWNAQGNKVAAGHLVDLSDSPFLYITEPVRAQEGETAPEASRR